MKNNISITILFSGYSINNTPKIINLYNSLKSVGYNVKVAGIVKDSTQTQTQIDKDCKLYSKGDTQGIFKLVRVFALQTKLLYYLIFRDKSKLLYTINPISGVVGLIVAILTRKKMVYESHEMVFGLNYPFFRGKWKYLWIIIEKTIALKADKFIATDQFRLKFIRRYYKLPSNKLEYILNVPVLKPNFNKLKTTQKLGIKSKTVISYCGGITPERGIENIIKAFYLLSKNSQDFMLVLAGSISNHYKKNLESLINKFSISSDRYLFTGQLTNEVLFEYMAASDITFALYKQDSLNNRMSSPNKIFDSLHSETLVVASSSFLTDKVIKSNNIGVTINNQSVDSILIALNKCLDIKKDPPANLFNEQLKKAYCWETEFKRIKFDLFDKILS